MACRRFELHRTQDVSGVSGTGVVADGVVFDDGVTVLHWRGPWSSTVVHHGGIAGVQHIHGHGGATEIVWIDIPKISIPDADRSKPDPVELEWEDGSS